MTFYVTTAIPYVNAPPHLGHTLELVQADVLARHRRSRGETVRLLTGTDDNALKNVAAARAAGDFRAATAALWAEVDRGNRLIEAAQPWKLAEPAPVLAEVLGSCRVLADELRPFLPSGAERLRAQLRADGPPRPVFPRLGTTARRSDRPVQPPRRHP